MSDIICYNQPMSNHIPRHYDSLDNYMQPGKVAVIYGPRRIGKTTLVENYLANETRSILKTTGDNITTRNILGSQDLSQIIAWAAGYDIIFIDEAQQIPYIGLALKMLIDHQPNLTIIATGSSSFDLYGQLGEPLTGRQTPLMMFPVSIDELQQQYANEFELKQSLESYLVYGNYPEVILADTNAKKQELLRNLTSSYLYKDILALDTIKNSRVISDLLQLVALQIGSEVSLNELANTLGIDKKTVARYLDIFEKCFILYNLRGFSRNLRSEITKTSKYYFYDNGVRNAVVNNFNRLNLRSDTGALWENFLVMERLKARTYGNIYARDHFWRTWEKKEIDLIEDRGGKLHAYEFKWSSKKTAKAPRQFTEAYPDASYSVITPENFLEFVIPAQKEAKK